ncbi:MAG: phosphoglucomutase/phosphomannomutase family protein [Elusimicrobia bacterium]|nr:phosphoglucomutase/phosphomannomutase family protein [Elusimicrobiota bacterium]
MIRFGTGGWRAQLCDEFTFFNVRKVAHAISASVKENPDFGAASADYLAWIGAGKRSPVPVVVVGYDSRFLSEDFAHEVAAVFALDGIKTIISSSDAPTPAVAAAVLARRAVGGFVITASQSPAQMSGIKWLPFWGGAATPAVTEDIERRVDLLGAHTVKTMSLDRSLRESWVETVDLRPGYFKQLCSLLDVKAIKRARLKVAVDAMHGTTRGYMRPLLESLGVEVAGLHEKRDVLFGGRAPEPSPESLGELAQAMARKRLGLGLACDGDGDRFGILDAGGRWIPPNEVLALALEHLVANRGMKGKVARSVMTSHFVDAVAKSHGLDARETPVGFKFIGDLLRTGQFVLGGEESGGLSIRGHTPDKDGLLACLLMLELAAYERKPLAAVRDRLFKRVGAFHHAREDFAMTRPRQIQELEERLRVRPPLDLAGGSVWRIDQSDGFKFILRDGSWLGLRSSGTEQAFRLYAEAHDPKKLSALVASGKKLLQGRL